MNERSYGGFSVGGQEQVRPMESAVLDYVQNRLEAARARRIRAGRPLVTLSYAQSLDGSIASLNRRPLALSSLHSLTVTHALRALHEAILVGIGCVLADNPRLTVRLVPGGNPQPIIIDSRLRFPFSSHLLGRADPAPWIVTTEKAESGRQKRLEGAGARVIRLPAAREAERIDLSRLLSFLRREGIRSLMVEGGARIITNFITQRLVDQVVITIAPLLVGGLRVFGRSLRRDGYGFPRLRNIVYEQFEEDLILCGEPDWEGR